MASILKSLPSLVKVKDPEVVLVVSPLVAPPERVIPTLNVTCCQRIVGSLLLPDEETLEDVEQLVTRPWSASSLVALLVNCILGHSCSAGPSRTAHTPSRSPAAAWLCRSSQA